MKIRKIEFENFKIFKNRVSINFDSNNNHFFILGGPGRGKTTLYNAIKWIMLGDDSVKSADDEILFNIKVADECILGDKIAVNGEMIFDISDESQEECTYWLKRKWVYRKAPTGLKLISKECHILKEDSNMWVFLEEHPRDFFRKLYYGRIENHMFLGRENPTINLRYLDDACPLIVDIPLYTRKREELEKILKLYSSQMILISHYPPKIKYDKLFEIICDVDRTTAELEEL